jgi:hypothetical protein
MKAGILMILPYSNISGGRENDGDLTHYNVYLDGVLVEDSVEVTGYLVTGLPMRPPIHLA